jgi:hypothetical protein
MPVGLPKGFVRVGPPGRSRLDLFGRCPHPNFDQEGCCLSCSYSLRTLIRKQIRDLELCGRAMNEEERVTSVIAILTAPKLLLVRAQTDSLVLVRSLPGTFRLT